MASNLANLSLELEFVDQAAVEVLQRNARDSFNRRANERRDELDRVLRRVDHICSNFENYEAFSAGRSANVQYLSGLDELEKIVNDPQAKKKYLDDVTIFVVGYENACKSRVGLIEQVSEFLLENENLFDGELNTESVVDFEELNSSVEETIHGVGELSDKIGELHRSVVESITAHYNSKGAQKQKKKLEKALEEAKKELGDLSDKLVHVNTELQDRDLKVQQMSRQLESKNSELQKLRAAAEVNKNAATQLAELQAQMQQRSEEFESLKSEMESLREEMDKELHKEKLDAEILQAEHQKLQEEAAELRQQLAEAQSQHREAQAALLELRESVDSQLEEARVNYKRRMAALKKKHEAELAKLQTELRQAYTEMSRQESEFDENKQTVFISDDDEEPTRMPTEEDVLEFEDTIEFDNEAAWNSVPRSHCRGRFAEYRRLARERLSAQATELLAAQQRTEAKTLRLKARFNEFREQWEQERAGLEESLKMSEQETEDAKRKAEAAAKKLEEVYERMQETQALSSAEGDQLQAHLAQLQVSRAQLETRVDDLEHQTQTLNDLLSKARKEKEAAEQKLAEALAAAARPESKQKSAEISDDIFDDIHSDQSDVDVPFPEDRSGSQSRGPGLHLADHPVVGEFMRNYRSIMRASARLSSVLTDGGFEFKEVAGNLSAVQAHELDRGAKIIPQIEQLGKNLTFVSDQIFLLIENIALHLEKQKQQQQPQQQQQQQPDGHLQPQQEQQQQQQLQALENQYKARFDALLKKIDDLQAKYDSVTEQLQAQDQQQCDELSQRDAAIAELQQSVTSLTAEVQRLRAEQQFELQNSLMFTKLDAERNTKTLKRALASRRIEESEYQSTVEAMTEYSSVPATRLLAVTRRLLQRDSLLRAEASVVGDPRLSRRAPQLLRQLEQLDAGRSRRYEQIMDCLRERRLRLAAGLVDTFDDIGQSCSIFLIRPVLSLRHRENLQRHLRTVEERNGRRRQQRIEEERRLWTESRRLSVCVEEPDTGRLPDIGNSGVRQRTDVSDMWDIGASSDMKALPPGFDRAALNTPRLLEMDVNKILLGQNRISASLDASGEGLRYYMPLKRRATDNFAESSLQQEQQQQQQQQQKQQQQQQQQKQQHEQGVPPTTPMVQQVSRTSVASPLPPIKAKTHS